MSKRNSVLTLETVRRHVDDVTLQRGREYALDKRITRARRMGETLKADCYGSGENLYRVQATVQEGEIREADCSCPVGEGGHCKHTAALLLTFLEHPQLFRTLEDLDRALERRSKQELVTLIKQMLRQAPDLEALLEIPLARNSEGGILEAEVIRQQVRARFEQSGYRWGSEGLIASAIDAILDLGDDYVTSLDWRNATTVFHTVLDEVLEQLYHFHDESGALRMLIERSIHGLAECYSESATDAALRAETLRALYDVYQFDTEFGGIGVGEAVPEILLEYATPEEKQQLRQWAREAMAKRDRDQELARWRREQYGAFLLRLAPNELDDEQYIQICRETGRVFDLVERLLSLGRVEEARQAATDANDYQLVELAERFVKYKQEAVAEQLIEARAAKSQDTRLAEWLIRYYQSQKDKASALRWTRLLFEQRPSPEHFQALSELAPSIEWPKLRAELLGRLETKGYFGLLTRIHLDEDNIEMALRMVERTGSGRGPEFGLDLRSAVAKAAEVTHPHAAISLYQQCAERLIAQRGRVNYIEACKYLAQAGRLARSSGKMAEWDAYIRKLDADHRMLRALREEMLKTRLVPTQK